VWVNPEGSKRLNRFPTLRQGWTILGSGLEMDINALAARRFSTGD
jgi:hypothetical protein